MSPAPMAKRMAPKRAALVMPLWVSSAPLGVPVVPEVYTSWATSSGATGRGGGSSGPDAQNAAQSLKATTSRRAGSSPRSASIVPRTSWPRCAATVKTAADADCPRTWRSSSVRSAGLTGTRINPASAAP